jgi:hypothetical protein
VFETSITFDVDVLGTTNVEIRISNATGSNNIDFYEIFRDGTNIQDDLSYTFINMRYNYQYLTANTTYTLQVKAFESDGTPIVDSNILTVTTGT